MSRIKAVLIIIGLFIGAASAAPTGFVVNSDGPNENADSLFEIDLATGNVTQIGKLQTQLEDVEGLAFGPDGRLYAADDATDTLFTVSTTNAAASLMNSGVGNLAVGGERNDDFGLTFDCDGRLLMSSDTNQSLYQVDLESGTSSVIGSNGGLKAAISGLAASDRGIFGLGAMGSQSLFQIDADQGTATAIGPLDLNFEFEDGGLAFDAEGVLWGVADRRSASVSGEPSVIFQVNLETGKATVIAETIVGVESLAIAAPPCGGTAPGPAVPIPIFTLWAKVFLILSMLGLAGLRLRRSRNS